MWNSTWIACMLTAGLLVSQQTPYERSDGSWLDAPMEWNLSPTELLRGQPEGPNPKCDPTVRAPQSAAERLLTVAGWKLRTISEVKRSGGHSIEIVQAFRQFDGMCRDLQAQAFVFVNDRLVGTLSPRLMNGRADGQLAKAVISESGEITATFLRYNPTDALCCPSRESLAFYSTVPEAGTHVVKLLPVETRQRSER